jgi:hypothetical protein
MQGPQVLGEDMVGGDGVLGAAGVVVGADLRRLDDAVCAAYAAAAGGEWRADMPEDAILANLLALDLVRAAG